MSTLHDGLRYTLRGSADIEKRLSAIVARAAGCVAKNFCPREYRALVLLGGYGRGEGGAFTDENGEHPHNNLDMLLIASKWGMLRHSALKRRLDDVLLPLANEAGIGIDTGVLGEFELLRAPPRVIWFDLRWGHRTILGDASVIPSLQPLAAREIEIDDVHNLLVNRASLLVINDAMLDRGNIPPEHKRYIIKHLMKAILGHGDALLFARGRYHASYLEKQRRMRELDAPVPGLADLYDVAAEFRFSPRYEQYAKQNLTELTNRIRDVLASAHIAFERFRSRQDDCTFADHVDRMLEEKPSPNAFRRRAEHLVHWGRFGLRRENPAQPKAARRRHPRTILAATLPTVLYGSNAEQTQAVRALLGADACDARALRHAYLRYWATHGDPNFHHIAEQLGIPWK